MLRKAIALSAFLLALLPISAHAHGWMITASTPLTPPLTLIWITPLFILAVTWWDWKLLNAEVKKRYLINTNLVVAFYIILIIFIIGILLPVGAPSTPAMPLLGMSWSAPGIIYFLFANIAQLTLFLVFKYHRLKWLKVSPKPLDDVLWSNAHIYGICILPFLLFASTMHGNGGFYIGMECTERRMVLVQGVIEYAKAHNEILPVAGNITELLRQIKPYLNKDITFYQGSSELDTCPFEAARQLYPKHYEWNTSLSGITMTELKKRYNDPIITCHTNDWLHKPSVITLMNLVKWDIYKDPELKAILEKERPG